MLFEDLFNEDVKSVSVVTDITDGKQKVVELGKDFDNYVLCTYGKAIKDHHNTVEAAKGMRKAVIYFTLATGASILLQRKLVKRAERQYKDICDDMFSDKTMDKFVMKAFEEQFGNDSNKEN